MSLTSTEYDIDPAQIPGKVTVVDTDDHHMRITDRAFNEVLITFAKDMGVQVRLLNNATCTADYDQVMDALKRYVNDKNQDYLDGAAHSPIPGFCGKNFAGAVSKHR